MAAPLPQRNIEILQTLLKSDIHFDLKVDFIA